VRHTAGDDPQAVVEHTLVVHCRRFYFVLVFAVNETSTIMRTRSLSIELLVNRWLVSKVGQTFELDRINSIGGRLTQSFLTNC
jgi:hypothetical protein